MAATAPSVTTAVENHSTAISSHTGRGLGLACAGGFVQDSSAGSALRSAAAALSISAMSRASWSVSAPAGGAELSASPGVRPRSPPQSCENRPARYCRPRSPRKASAVDASTWRPPVCRPPESLEDKRRGRDIHYRLTLTACGQGPIQGRSRRFRRRPATAGRRSPRLCPAAKMRPRNRIDLAAR